jgi:hypothetical protein
MGNNEYLVICFKVLKSLPISTVFQDPRNNYSYQIIERDNNSTFSKAAVPYLGEIFIKKLNPYIPIKPGIREFMFIN